MGHELARHLQNGTVKSGRDRCCFMSLEMGCDWQYVDYPVCYGEDGGHLNIFFRNGGHEEGPRPELGEKGELGRTLLGRLLGFGVVPRIVV